MHHEFLRLSIVAVVIMGTCSSDFDSFHEELFIKPLNNENVYTHFHFNTKWSVDRTDFAHHSRLFPRILGEMVERYNVQELQVSLTNGLWRYQKWGYPVVNAGTGGEVWAWFNLDTVDIDENWRLLTSSLSGLLCSSFNFIDSTNTLSPTFSFRPSGVVHNLNSINSSYLKYSNLPREIVCTENLTPWKKLLPCKAKAGLSSLLNSGNIHNTKYHSLGLHLRRMCRSKGCSETVLDLTQTVSLVYDHRTLGTNNWSLVRFYGQGVLNYCALAKFSNIYVDLSLNQSKPFRLTMQPDEVITSNRGGTEGLFARYEMKEGGVFSVGVDHFATDEIQLNVPPVLYAHQYLCGYGKENGGLIVRITNNYWSHLDVVVLQNIPWFLQIYLHTLRIRDTTRDLKPTKLNFVPGKLRTSHHSLELLLRLPPKSTVKIWIDFDFTFLKWQEYPPDANHGFYIPPAVVSSNLPLARNFTGLSRDSSTIRDSFNASRSGYLVQIRTETVIVTLPTPDFSMPYNVICLACTVVALAFGPLHNITTKRFILKQKEERKLIDKLRDKLNAIIFRNR